MIRDLIDGVVECAILATFTALALTVTFAEQVLDLVFGDEG